MLRTFGALPNEERARSVRGKDLRWCARHMTLDEEEELDRLCPVCRAEAEEGRCPVCGGQAVHGDCGQNAAFDEERFRTLSRGAKG